MLPRIISSIYNNIIIKISCGKYHVLLLSIQGECFSLGFGLYGQLGHRNKKNVYNPILINDLSKLKIQQIGCGLLHSIAISEDGKLYQWGYLSSDYLGTPEIDEIFSAPLIVNTNHISGEIVSIFAGGWNSSFVTENGQLYIWGFNNLSTNDINIPKLISTHFDNKNVIRVSIGYSHILVIVNSISKEPIIQQLKIT
jgi:alpha-tubulin suppressor-like RCC1 family protein